MYYPQKPMINRSEQVQLYSEAEFARRRDGIRRIMSENHVDKLIFLDPCEEAYDEWLTGTRFLEYVVVSGDGSVLCVSRKGYEGGRFAWTDPSQPFEREEGAYTRCGFLDDGAVARRIASGPPSRIGLVLPEKMNVGLSAALAGACPQAEQIDLSVPVALFRAVKSREELYAAAQSRNIQAAVFDALAQIIRIGRTLGDINEELQYLLMQLGASGMVHAHLICNGPQDAAPASFFGLPPEHKAEYGDRFFALLEGNGPGHHHVAFGRHLLIGEPSREWAKCVDDAVEIHRYAVSLMRPEAVSLAQISVKTRKFANRLGYPLYEHVGWNWMHGMGGYYYEQYSLEDYTEDIPLRNGILLHCHPQIQRPAPNGRSEDVMILNTYLLTEQGASDLIKIPMGLKVLY